MIALLLLLSVISTLCPPKCIGSDPLGLDSDCSSVSSFESDKLDAFKLSELQTAESCKKNQESDSDSDIELDSKSFEEKYHKSKAEELRTILNADASYVWNQSAELEKTTAAVSKEYQADPRFKKDYYESEDFKKLYNLRREPQTRSVIYALPGYADEYNNARYWLYDHRRQIEEELDWISCSLNAWTKYIRELQYPNSHMPNVGFLIKSINSLKSIRICAESKIKNLNKLIADCRSHLIRGRLTLGTSDYTLAIMDVPIVDAQDVPIVDAQDVSIVDASHKRSGKNGVHRYKAITDKIKSIVYNSYISIRAIFISWCNF